MGLGHSWIATGMVRRHMDGPTSCPLCHSAIETLEHLLFECPELALARGHWQSWYRTDLDRKKSAEKTIIKANKQESLMIHLLYRARVQKELSV